MTTFEIMFQVEGQQCELEKALSVLSEAMRYFESVSEIEYLPRYADQIYNLLLVAEGIFAGVEPKLGAVAEALLERCNKEKEIA